MTTNNRIAAICNHPSKLFGWPEHTDELGLRWRLSYSETVPKGRHHFTKRFAAHDRLIYNVSDHEAHALVAWDLREKLAKMGWDIRTDGKGSYYAARPPTGVTYDHRPTYLDALLFACEACLVEDRRNVVSPKLRRAAYEAAERQRNMTDADRDKGTRQIIEDTKNADD